MSLRPRMESKRSPSMSPQVNDVSIGVAKDVSQVNQAAKEIASASGQLNESATELSQFAETPQSNHKPLQGVSGLQFRPDKRDG